MISKPKIALREEDVIKFFLNKNIPNEIFNGLVKDVKERVASVDFSEIDPDDTIYILKELDKREELTAKEIKDDEIKELRLDLLREDESDRKNLIEKLDAISEFIPSYPRDDVGVIISDQLNEAFKGQIRIKSFGELAANIFYEFYDFSRNDRSLKEDGVPPQDSNFFERVINEETRILQPYLKDGELIEELDDSMIVASDNLIFALSALKRGFEIYEDKQKHLVNREAKKKGYTQRDNKSYENRILKEKASEKDIETDEKTLGRF